MLNVEIVFHGAPGARVAVAGDFPGTDFREHLPLVEEAPGVFRRTFALANGVYRYKLIVDGVWTLDPCALVDRSEGVDNNVIVVGNRFDPPVFMPEDARHLNIVNDIAGGVGVVRARLEIADDSTPPPPLVVDVAGASVSVPLVQVLRRGGRRFFTTPAQSSLPSSSSSSSLGIDGAVFYGVFLDRWRRGSGGGAPPDRRVLARTTPSTPFVFYGGDLDGVRESVPSLADLGVTHIVITPVSLSESPHRYDATDPLVVDPRIGGEAAFARLVAAAHERGLKVIVDASLTHVSDRHAAFRDVVEHQQASRYQTWFRVMQWPVRPRDRSCVGHYYNASDQPWLNLDDAACADHMIGAACRLIELGADGLRLDAMDEAPLSFWRAVRKRVKEKSPSALLLGECVTDALWEKAGVADVVTDFRIRDSLVAFVAKRAIDAREYVERCALYAFRTGAFASSFRLGFADNNDTARFLSLCDGDERRLRIALALLLFAEECAWITYGTEEHLTAARRGERALDNAWLERLPMPPDDRPTATRALIRALCAVRREMRGAPLTVERAEGSQLALRRGSRTLHVDVAGEQEPRVE